MEIQHFCSHWLLQKSQTPVLFASRHQLSSLIRPIQHWYAVLAAKLSLKTCFRSIIQSCQCDDLCQLYAEMPAQRQQMPHYNPCRAAMKYAGRDLVPVSWSVIIDITGAKTRMDWQGPILTFKILHLSSVWSEYAPCSSQLLMTRASYYRFPCRVPFTYIVTVPSLRGCLGLFTLSLRAISLQRLWSRHCVETQFSGMPLQSRCRQSIYYLLTLSFHPFLLLLSYKSVLCKDLTSFYSYASTKPKSFHHSHSFINYALFDTSYHLGLGVFYTGPGKVHNRR